MACESLRAEAGQSVELNFPGFGTRGGLSLLVVIVSHIRGRRPAQSGAAISHMIIKNTAPPRGGIYSPHIPTSRRYGGVNNGNGISTWRQPYSSPMQTGDNTVGRVAPASPEYVGGGPKG
jgi:hypothetical protein